MGKNSIFNLMLWTRGIKQGPSLVTLRVTNICDLRCIFCTAKEKKTLKDELELENYERLFSSFNKLGVKLCGIVGGGEALCKQKLTLGIIKLIYKYKMHGWLVTNGLSMDRTFMKELITQKLDTILFSIDGPTAETHDYLRGKKGAFNKIIKNIQLLNKLKEHYNSKNPFLKIQMLITNKNYKQIKYMLKLLRLLKAEQLMLNFLVNHTPECKELHLNKIETNELKITLKELLKDKRNIFITNFGDFIEILNGYTIKKNPNNQLKQSYCFQPWYHVNITENGYLNFCPELHKWQKDSIREKSIEEIWSGSNITTFRKKILNNELFNVCKKYCNMPILIENKRIGVMLRNG